MARLLQRLIKGYGLLTVALIVFTACAFLSMGRIRAEHEVETKATAVSFWIIDQANSELQLLINALDGYALGYLGVTHQDLLDRLDIFWSRVPLLLEGTEGERLRRFTEAATIVPEILADLKAIEPELLELRPNDAASHRRIRDQLAQLLPLLHRVLLQTNHAFADGHSDRSAEFNRLYDQQLAYQIGILISASIFIVFLLREIRTAHAAESRAEEARGHLQSIVDAVPARICVTDHESRVVLVNRYQCDLEGLDEAQVIGQRLGEIGMGDEADERNLKVIATGEAPPQFEEMLCDRQGWERAWLTTKVPIVDGSGEVKRVLSASLDITERKAAEARLAHLALHDPLTDLPNRTLFHDRLAQQLRRAQRDGSGVAVICIDLDGFKDINDAYGHASGDALLVAVAARMRAALRRSDTIARLGGDEFAVILSDATSPNAVVQIADKLVKVLSEPCTIEGNQLLTGVSIGISLAPQDGMEPEQLLKFADLALYDAKSDHGTGFRFFHASMNARVSRRRELQLELRRALDTQGFEVHYQPKFTLPDRQMCGMEALLRWPHPELGMVPPSEFIPVAEDTGLIIELGAYVLREACRQNRVWQQAEGGTVPVAVNLSASQFVRRDLATLITSILQESGLEPELLELEITESVLLRNAEEALAVLSRLRQLGILIALDDFGTGYSSLSYLQRFPIDKIKIDRSFVSDLGHSTSAADIVRTIISLAKTLNLTVVAEGVETAAQLDDLERMGCDEVQGYYLEVPQAPSSITAMLATRRSPTRATAAHA